MRDPSWIQASKFLERLPAVAWIKDHEGKYRFINRAFERKFKVRCPRVLGKTDQTLWPPAVAARLRKNDLRVATSASGRHLVEEVPVPGGQTKSWLVYKLPWPGPAGKRWTCGFAIDITDHVRTEKALQASQEELRILVEGIRDYAVIMLDPKGVIRSWNLGAERTFGYKAADVQNKHVALLYPRTAAEQEEGRRDVERARRSGSVETEGRRVRKDGSVFLASTTMSALKDTRGRLRGFVRVSRDITDRKRAEERFRLAVESAPNAMVMADAAGRVVLVNAQAEKLFGYSREELLDLSVDGLVPDRFRGRHSGYRQEFMSRPGARSMGAGRDLFALRKDGTEVPVEIGLNPIRTEDGIYVLAAVVDISERRKAEELAQRHRRVEEAYRLTGQFVANLSHELRTPLNAIIGFSQLLHDGKIPDPLEQKECLGDVLSNARHLLDLIGQILDVAKIEAGNLQLHPEEVDIGRLVEEVRNAMRALADGAGVRVESRVNGKMGRVIADPARLKQVLYNYLSNAIKFTPKGGSVTLRAVPEGNRAFRIEVEDTGPGISKGDLSRLFKQFQQLDPSSSKRHAGTGLGLFLTKSIVEAHGGSVGVRSIPGKGSTFYASIPRKLKI